MWPQGSVPKAGVTLLLTTPGCEGTEGGLARAQQGLGKLRLDPLPGAIHDHLVGEDVMADYLLYTLNKQQQFG